MKKYFSYLLILLLALLFACSSDNKSKEFLTDQKAFSQSIELIFKKNSESNKALEEIKSNPNDTALITKTLNSFIVSNKEIINESEKVSDEFLDEISLEFKTDYRHLLDEYKISANTIQSKNNESEDTTDLDKNTMIAENSFWNYFQAHQSEIIKKFPMIGQDFKATLEKLKVPSTKEDDKIVIDKSYWGIIWRLAIGDFAVTFIFSLLISILVALNVLTFNATKKLKLNSMGTLLILLSAFFGFLAQTYLWVLWSAFCSYSVSYFIDSPSVTQNWIYYLTGFFASWGPMSYLLSKELDTVESAEEKNKIYRGSSMYILISIISFIIFCVFPNLLSSDFISFIYNRIY